MDDGESIAAQLEKLETLRAKGTLSEAEFQKLKSALVTKAVPKTSGTAAWLIGAAAVVAVVIVVFLLIMPRHAADKVAVAPPSAQTVTPSAPKPEPSNAPIDRAANDAAAPSAAAEPPSAGPPP